MDKKNQITSFLMVVGIIFIVISGTIFVSSTWKYLPTYAKQGIMFLVSLCLFTGSYKIAKGGVLKKTETALYYLAVSFLGMLTMSLCDEIIKSGKATVLGVGVGWSKEAIMLAGAVMLITAAIRFVRIHRVFDFTMVALLADWVVFWFVMSCGFGILGFCISSAITLTVYTAADFLRDRWIGSKNVEQAFFVLYIIHIVYFVIYNIKLVTVRDAFIFRAGMFSMAIFMVCVTSLHLIRRKHLIFSVLNSLSIYWCIITGVRFANEMLSFGGIRPWGTEVETFIIFSLCAACMVVFARMEMFGVTAFFGIFLPFMQLSRYGDYRLLFHHVNHIKTVYIPFSGVFAVASAIMIIRMMRAGKLNQDMAKQCRKAVFMQIIVMIIVYTASKIPFFDRGIYSLFMLQCIALSFLFKEKNVKLVFRTFALIFGEILASLCTNDFIPADYQVEWGCFMTVVGVFLLGVIWKNHGEKMRQFQFLCVSGIMVVLLFNSMYTGGVGNALILGITGALMLFVAAIRNHHKYAVLSSVILIVLAFYLTRSFWLSIEWWVYLFVAGVVLVALAIIKEKSSGN